jgi:cytochrome P450
MPDWAAWPFPTADPYPSYHAARERASVQWNEQLGAYLVLSYEHAAAVLRDGEWTADPRNALRQLASLGGPSPVPPVWNPSSKVNGASADARIWAAVSRFLTPQVKRRIRKRVGALVDSVVAAHAGGERIELMRELAYPIPLAVLRELLDLDTEGTQLLALEAPKLARLLELDPSPDELEQAGAAAMTVLLLLVPILARRRRDPGEDLLSALTHISDGGATLESKEIFAMCLILLAASHQFTANLIGNGTLALFEHPDQLDWLERDAERSHRAVDELLRYDSPAQIATRVARSDLVLAGIRVREGERALVVLGAANRDPAHYPDPDRLVLARTGPPHLAFGDGLRCCVGAALARLGAEETILRLARSPLRRSVDSTSLLRDDAPAFRRLQTLRLERKHREPAPRPEPGRPPRATRPGPREAGRFSKNALGKRSRWSVNRCSRATTTQGEPE